MGRRVIDGTTNDSTRFARRNPPRTGPYSSRSSADSPGRHRHPRTSAAPRRANAPPDAPSDWRTPIRWENVDARHPADRQPRRPADAADPRLEEGPEGEERGDVQEQVEGVDVKQHAGAEPPRVGLDQRSVLAADRDPVVDAPRQEQRLPPREPGSDHHPGGDPVDDDQQDPGRPRGGELSPSPTGCGSTKASGRAPLSAALLIVPLLPPLPAAGRGWGEGLEGMDATPATPWLIGWCNSTHCTPHPGPLPDAGRGGSIRLAWSVLTSSAM